MLNIRGFDMLDKGWNLDTVNFFYQNTLITIKTSISF